MILTAPRRVARSSYGRRTADIWAFFVSRTPRRGGGRYYITPPHLGGGRTNRPPSE